MEAWRAKMEFGESAEEEDTAGCMEGDLKLVVISNLPALITKLPL